MFEIYAYGNVDTLTGVFNAIAAIMGGDDYFGLVKTVAVTGVLVAAFAGLFTPGRFHGWSWLIGFMLLYYGLLGEESTVGKSVAASASTGAMIPLTQIGAQIRAEGRHVDQQQLQSTYDYARKAVETSQLSEATALVKEFRSSDA